VIPFGLFARFAVQKAFGEALKVIGRAQLRQAHMRSMLELLTAVRPPMITCHIDTSKLMRDLQYWQKTYVPQAIAGTLNETGKFIQQQLAGEMGRVFDRPTNWTLNSTYLKRATVQSLEAVIKIKDEAFKSVPAIRWLGPQVYGGGRDAKRSEILLRQNGILGSDEYIVPGAGAKLDAYGNISRGQMQQILSRVGASRDVLQRAYGKVSKAKGKSFAETYFYLREPRGRLTRRGIYRRVIFASSSAVEPVLIFVKQPRYRQRLRFFEIVDQVFQTRYPLQLKIELEKAIQSGAAKHLI